MKKILKKISILALALVLTMGTTVSSFADVSSVTYEGDADQFVFNPGSGYSPTDLFTEFKGVMPGDTISQMLEVKNTTSDEYKVVLYMKALGASDLKDVDGNEVVSYEDSAELLNQMTLSVTAGNGSEYFNALADETAGLTDWVCIGEVYYGGSVELKVDLNVPIAMDNDFKNRIGALQWSFKAEEIPVNDNPGGVDEQPDDDKDKDKDKDKDGKLDSAKTGDNMNLLLLGGVCLAALVVILVLVLGRRRKEE